MFNSLPATSHEFQTWPWERLAPYYDDLAARPISPRTVDGWLRDWTRLQELVEESFWRLYAAANIDKTDAAAEQAFNRFVEQTQPAVRVADQRLKELLLRADAAPPGFDIPLRNLRAEAALYREDNLALLAEEQKLASEYGSITGAQLVEWEGQLLTLTQLHPQVSSPDRATRERAWRLAAERRLQDRSAIFDVWERQLSLRRRLAANAGLGDYRAYRWRQLYRFDYTPADCEAFHAAIEAVAVPAASAIYARRRAALGVETLRPWDANWDVYVDPQGRPPVSPFTGVIELIEKTAALFGQLDPTLAGYFDLMRREGLLDLDNRPHKGPSAWCTSFAAARRPFIFMNAVGTHDDLMTLIHESGHAFHWCESYALPYFQQRGLDFMPIEFVEVASMSMEYLNAPNLAAVGFYSEEDAARARIEHLEQAILYWPHMACVDAWQHWAYTHPDEAANPDRCDAVWLALRRRFIPDVDWTGLEAYRAIGWQERPHIFEVPFYYVEYGLAQLGAVQVWRNALTDPVGALRQYRHALSLGVTASVPDLYAAAGARFAFDAPALREAIALMGETIDRLRSG